MSEACPQCGAALDVGWPGFYGRSCILSRPEVFELLPDLREDFRRGPIALVPSSWWRRICRSCFSVALLNNPQQPVQVKGV